MNLVNQSTQYLTQNKHGKCSKNNFNLSNNRPGKLPKQPNMLQLDKLLPLLDKLLFNQLMVKDGEKNKKICPT